MAVTAYLRSEDFGGDRSDERLAVDAALLGSTLRDPRDMVVAAARRLRPMDWASPNMPQRVLAVLDAVDALDATEMQTTPDPPRGEPGA